MMLLMSGKCQACGPAPAPLSQVSLFSASACPTFHEGRDAVLTQMKAIYLPLQLVAD